MPQGRTQQSLVPTFAMALDKPMDPPYCRTTLPCGGGRKGEHVTIEISRWRSRTTSDVDSSKGEVSWQAKDWMSQVGNTLPI